MDKIKNIVSSLDHLVRYPMVEKLFIMFADWIKVS